MNKDTIQDYWCYGCGLVANTAFACPLCGSIDYRTITLNIADNPKKDLIRTLYEHGSLFVHRHDGRLEIRDRSIGPVAIEGKKTP